MNEQATELIKAINFEANVEGSKLAGYLVEPNSGGGRIFNWYLMVECNEQRIGKLYGKVVFQHVYQLPNTYNVLETESTNVWQQKTERPRVFFL